MTAMVPTNAYYTTLCMLEAFESEVMNFTEDQPRPSGVSS